MRFTLKRTVIGSLADGSVRYENGRPVTLIHILEFRTDVFPGEPKLSELRLCGDNSSILDSAVHTNVVVVYGLASASKLTGCLGLIRVDRWAGQ
jgi:hypothetical protein